MFHPWASLIRVVCPGLLIASPRQYPAMNILLINPPDDTQAMLGAGRELIQKHEPLGLLYVAALARSQGHDVSVIDAHAESLDSARIKARLLAARPDILGFSVLTCNGALVHELGRWAKENLPGTLVVLGNIHASIYASQYLAHGCRDAVVHGEGEEPFLALVEHRRDGRPFGDIPAISFRDPEGRIARTPPDRYLVADLTRLPRPARDLVDMRRYPSNLLSNQLYVGGRHKVSRPMSTSRGCRYGCVYCVVNQKPRFDSAARAVDEMELLEKEFGADHAAITDPCCMDDQQRMLDICAEIRRRRLKIKWGCDARASHITPELVRALAGANCFDLSFGMESGVQRLIDAVHKGLTIEQIIRAVATVKEHSEIRLGGLFMLGLPGETCEDSLETINFAKSLPLDMAQFSLCTPYPGSALFETLRGQGRIDTGLRPEGGLDTSVWKRYSAYISFTSLDPIWVTPEQTPAQLKALQKKAQREFYLRPSQLLRHASRLRPGNIGKALAVLKDAFI